MIFWKTSILKNNILVNNIYWRQFPTGIPKMKYLLYLCIIILVVNLTNSHNATKISDLEEKICHQERIIQELEQELQTQLKKLGKLNVDVDTIELITDDAIILKIVSSLPRRNRRFALAGLRSFFVALGRILRTGFTKIKLRFPKRTTPPNTIPRGRNIGGRNQISMGTRGRMARSTRRTVSRRSITAVDNVASKSFGQKVLSGKFLDLKKLLLSWPTQ